MWLGTQSLRKAAEVGTALANQFVTIAPEPPLQNQGRGAQTRQLQQFLSQVERDARPLRLGLFRRARLATSFKCRLLDNGVEADLANELTRLLLLRLSSQQATTVPDDAALIPPAGKPKARTVRSLLAQAEAAAGRGAHAAAAGYYTQVLAIKPGHPFACNNLGVALHKLHRYAESEVQFRRAVRAQPTYHDGLKNLGNTLRLRGQYVESELPLRKALKIRPGDVDTLWALGQALVLLNRLADARQCFDSALRVSGGHPGSLCGLAQIAGIEGRFDEAETLYRRALQTDPDLPAAWAALVGLRKMSYADLPWLKAAEKLTAGTLAPLEEADLRFAMGKFYDDVGNFAQAFRNYERANQLQKSAAVPYDREARTRFVGEMIRAYPAGSLRGPQEGSSDSVRPVFVVGMMRSGTSLIEQIISSHSAAAGAGELPFWNDVAHKHPEALSGTGLTESLRRKLSQAYLSTLSRQPDQAQRVVDKSTYNTDYLGLIHSVFPNARILYVRRDPLDVCLSCYFNQLSPAQNFAMDLEDLAHHYREHQLMMAHWASVLPAGTLLTVRYADLVSDQEHWTRKILEFIALGWDERCLDSHTVERPVLTASFWQVRQKIYQTSLGRWRNYKKFIAPIRTLPALRELEA
jgi:tetratricopeptide (TPR) repeat protein